ncbi:dynein regulatory complex subunit 3-like [Culicoides brevitarsis]|uniref:dynein regulatory complex subunit 3-like n=1 Tax=Culicoides brevitarsis TaxID=469753 RepID=UPI00307BEA78
MKMQLAEGKSEQAAALKKIIHKDIEPGVIDEEMIVNVVLSSYKNEAGRLARSEKIDLSNVTILRLEFLKILKIDHLWVMPNLRILSLAFNQIDKIENLDMLLNLIELNLSFNCIEKIENLDALTKLEILTLYGNRITVLENIDSLESLLIFSIGENQIDSYKGIERLRFIKSLRSFNMEENPVAKDTENPMRIYIAAFLPDLKYYNYAYITPQERLQGRKKYKSELRDLEETEKTEIADRKRRAKEKEDETRLSECFVEYLNGHQLFDSLFEDDPEGDALMSIETEVNELKKDYRDEAFRITQQVYKIGLEQHERRQKQIQLFMEAVKDGQITAQKKGISLIDTFLDQKKEIFRRVQNLIDNSTTQENFVISPETEIAFVQIGDAFNEKVVKLKKDLMSIEIQLYERVEEANSNFEHVIQDLTNEFIELVQAQFVLLRDAETNFNEVLAETVQRHATLLVASSPDGTSLPAALKEFLQDKDFISSLALGMRDLHLHRIDAREDRLITRSRNWVKELCDKFQRNEVKRNRAKISEITYFLQIQRDEMERLINIPQIDEDMRDEN